MLGRSRPTSARHCTPSELERVYAHGKPGRNQGRADGLRSKCGSGAEGQVLCVRGHVVEGRTCPPDPFNDMSFSIGRRLQGVGRCKSPAPADIRLSGSLPDLTSSFEAARLPLPPLHEPRKGQPHCWPFHTRCAIECGRPAYSEFHCRDVGRWPGVGISSLPSLWEKVGVAARGSKFFLA